MAKRSRRRRRRNRKKRGSNTVAEICTASHLTTDHMIPGFDQNQQWMHPPYEVDPWIVCGQDPYYPATNNHGHLYSGFHPQSEYYGHQSVFGVCDSTYNHLAMQAGTYPSVSYPPDYGFGSSYYNYCNHYTNGGFVGVGGPIPQHFSYLQYHQHFRPIVLPSANIPMQPSGAATPVASAAPSLSDTVSDTPKREGNAGAI